MKFNAIVSAVLLATVSTFSMGVQAESDAGSAPAANSPDAKIPVMKPHSHVEAKGGMVIRPSETKSEQLSPAKDMTKHFHPRDR